MYVLSFDIFIVQFVLGLILFFIINWIGKHSYSLGYLSISIFAKVYEAPAFNFIIRILSPVVYLFVTSAVLYAFDLDKYTYKFYRVSSYYILIRLLVNLITGRGLLLNWYKQALYWGGILFLSYYAYEKIIITKKNLLPDYANLSNELWIIIIVFIYQILNKLPVSQEGTIMRKGKYIDYKYRNFKHKYGEIINSLSNEKLISIAYSILIYEDFNRPYLIRKIENLKFLLTSKAHTLGVMQVCTSKYINDYESVQLGVKKLNDNYKNMVLSPKEEYLDKGEYSFAESEMTSDIINVYNGGYEYREAIYELFNIINERYYANSSARLVDGIKESEEPS